MTYEISLSYNNQESGFIVPVMPESIEISEAGKSSSYEVMGLGEINVLKGRELTGYSFSSFFPAKWYPFVGIANLQPPMAYIEKLLKWMGTKRPIRFTFTGDSFTINEAVSIESFDWKEVAGSGGDVEYSLKLKKYVFHAPKKVKVGLDESGNTVINKVASSRASERTLPETYTLASGDTLWGVAKKYLGDGARWSEIQRLNSIPDAKVRSLLVGMKLKLPVQGGG